MGKAIGAVLLQNVRHAFRRLRKKPGFTLTAVVSLAIGIGANTAIFSLINAILIRDTPLTAPEELVEVYLSTPDFPYNIFSYPDFHDLRDGTTEVFRGVTASRIILGQADRDGRGAMVPGEAVSGNYFGLLGIDMEIGRPLLPEDDLAPSAHPVVVLGFNYWQANYGGDPDIVGEPIRLSGLEYTIVGVAPENYQGNMRALVPAFYVPTMMVNEIQGNEYDELAARGNHSNFVKARLRPGVSLAEAQAAVDGLAETMREQDLENFDKDTHILLLPTADVILYPPIDRFVRAAAWLLTVVVGLVLLMACTNLASFLLAQSIDRKKEIALRLALGATRRHLIGRLLTESALLATIGGVAGIGVSVFLLRLLVGADLPLPIPLSLDLGLDLVVLTYTFAISLVAGLALGLVPALQATKPDVASTLKDEGAGSGQRGKLGLRNVLIGAQVAVSTVLLVGAGLFLRSLQEVQSVDPGFGRDPAAILTMMVPGSRFDENEGRLYMKQLIERIEQLPGVEDVGITGNLHLNSLSTSSTSFNVDGFEPPLEREAHTADTTTVDPGFFAATGIRIVSGRNFNDRDLPDTPAVAIISEALVTRFFPDVDPIGRSLRREGKDLQIVGVATDAKVRTLGEEPRFFVYRPYSQSYTSFITLIARTSRDPETVALELLSTAKDYDSELWAWETKTMARHIGTMLLPRQLSAVLLSAFAGLAIALAAIGLYGTVSYSVAQRTREIGIRMSLGADTASVLRMLMMTGMRPVVYGSLTGLAMALLMSRLLSSLLFGVSTLDPLTFAGAALALALTALVASWVPALRASRVSPITALRFE